MNTRRTFAQKVDEYIANVGDPPRDYQVSPLEQDVDDDLAPVKPPPLMYGDIRASFLKFSQTITTQEHDVTNQSQSLMTQANQEVIP